MENKFYYFSFTFDIILVINLTYTYIYNNLKNKIHELIIQTHLQIFQESRIRYHTFSKTSIKSYLLARVKNKSITISSLRSKLK